MFVNAPLWLRRLGWRAILLLALCLAGCGVPPHGTGMPLVQSFAWKMDASEQATLAEMETATDWQTFDGAKTWGFGTAPVWVRYTLRAALPDETGPWIVNIQPALLEHLVLYDPENQKELHSGQVDATREDALGTVDFTFQIPPAPHERNIFLRLQSQRSRLILTDVLPWREAIAQNQSHGWWQLFLISFSLALAVWALLQWLLNRDRVMGAFAVKQWIGTGWAFTQLGFARVLLGSSIEPQTLQTVELLLQNWAMASFFIYLVLLIQDYRPLSAWVKACGIYFAGLLLLFLLHFAGLRMQMRILVTLSVPVGLLLVWLTLLTAPKTSTPLPPVPRAFLTPFLLFYIAIGTLSTFVYLGWIPMHPAPMNANLNQLWVDGLFMVVLLQLRARRLAKQHQSTTRQLEQSQQDMALEQRQRQEQSQFLHMLMHELKTPLSIVSLALANRNKREENLVHASHAVQDMKAILERCIAADQVGGLRLIQHLQCVDVAQWIRQQGLSMPLLQARLQVLAPGPLPLLQTDGQLLHIILSNLLDNAAHYSDPLTPVTVDLSAQTQGQQAGVCVRVRNVPGLAGWPDAAQVFSKYYRASGAQRESGSGLGLYLSRQLAHSLGGSLTYEPHDQFVEFALWIPLHPA